MTYVNYMGTLEKIPAVLYETLLKLLSPFVPHIAEEMWEILGNAAPVSLKDWPTYNEAFIKEDEVEVLIQVLGKPKARIMMPVEADAAEMQRLAEADATVQKALEGKTVVKVIAVPKRVVNFVVR